MNGIHDMGGMHGFGPVVREEHEPVFHEPWEGRVISMTRRFGARIPPHTTGITRSYIEAIPPATYLQMSYYERWLEALVQRAIDVGVFTAEELEARIRRFEDDHTVTVPRRDDPEALQQTLAGLKRQLQASKEGHPPRFKEGDEVRAINVSRIGHNRLPRYIRDKVGVVERVNGLHPIEDDKAFAEDPTPQTVYTVGFDGIEVWGPECEPNLRVYLELWEGYLEPANTA